VETVLAATRLYNLYQTHKSAGCNEPLGLFFCRRYIKHYDDDTRRIFHEIDDLTALELINQWLSKHHHMEFLPPLNKFE
jgi:hypothetical protein